MKIQFLINFFILNFINTLKWSPEALAEKVPSWNYLNDPEDLIGGLRRYASQYVLMNR